eukprot:818991-Rhodomonas_salina.1
MERAKKEQERARERESDLGGPVGGLSGARAVDRLVCNRIQRTHLERTARFHLDPDVEKSSGVSVSDSGCSVEVLGCEVVGGGGYLAEELIAELRFLRAHFPRVLEQVVHGLEPVQHEPASVPSTA